MSKIKNGGLDQYGAEPFEQQQFGTAAVEGVKYKWTCGVCIVYTRSGRKQGAVSSNHRQSLRHKPVTRQANIRSSTAASPGSVARRRHSATRRRNCVLLIVIEPIVGSKSWRRFKAEYSKSWVFYLWILFDFFLILLQTIFLITLS